MGIGVSTVDGGQDLYDGYAVEFSVVVDGSGTLRVYEHRHASKRVVGLYRVEVWRSFSDPDGEHPNPFHQE
jgi:hypothetical protein